MSLSFSVYFVRPIVYFIMNLGAGNLNNFLNTSFLRDLFFLIAVIQKLLILRMLVLPSWILIGFMSLFVLLPGN